MGWSLISPSKGGGRDVLSRSSSRDCHSQEGQKESATNKGCPHIDPKSSGEGEIFDPGLSSSLHWTEGWSETKRLQWIELHPDLRRNEGNLTKWSSRMEQLCSSTKRLKCPFWEPRWTMQNPSLPVSLCSTTQT